MKIDFQIVIWYFQLISVYIKNHINNKHSFVYIKAKGNDKVEYQTTIFLVMIGGFIAVTILMQILGRDLPQN